MAFPALGLGEPFGDPAGGAAGFDDAPADAGDLACGHLVDDPVVGTETVEHGVVAVGDHPGGGDDSFAAVDVTDLELGHASLLSDIRVVRTLQGVLYPYVRVARTGERLRESAA
jgi:hypothetical protein